MFGLKLNFDTFKYIPIPEEEKDPNVDYMSEEEKKGLQLYIDPAVCIDCGACIPECPVEAIYADEEDAIEAGELDKVKENYEFFGQKFG